jgi:hypothetical protein
LEGVKPERDSAAEGFGLPGGNRFPQTLNFHFLGYGCAPRGTITRQRRPAVVQELVNFLLGDIETFKLVRFVGPVTPAKRLDSRLHPQGCELKFISHVRQAGFVTRNLTVP